MGELDICFFLRLQQSHPFLPSLPTLCSTTPPSWSLLTSVALILYRTDCRFLHVTPEDRPDPNSAPTANGRPIPYGLKKWRDRTYSASGPGQWKGGPTQEWKTHANGMEKEFEVRYVSRDDLQSIHNSILLIFPRIHSHVLVGYLNSQPAYGSVHPDKASIAQALASLPSNVKALNLNNSGATRVPPYGARNGHVHPGKPHHTHQNGPLPNAAQPPKQRIPSEEDFPSLSGSHPSSASSASLTSLNGGKTAAQILKSAAPGANKLRSATGQVPKTGGSETTAVTNSASATDAESEGASVKSGSGADEQVTIPRYPSLRVQ